MTLTPARAGRHVFISCGEASGDQYGAHLAAALRARAPGIRLSALGGPALAAAGVALVQRCEPLAVMGFGEVASALPALLAARRRVWRHLRGGGVDLCIPIDFPGFNLRVAAQARRRGIPVFYAIPPQLWAWGAWRLPALRRAVDAVGTILPFESAYFAQRGVPATPLGHPLVDLYAGFPFAAAAQEREERLARPDAALSLGLLPGSRRQEIRRLLPPLLAAARLLRRRLAPRPLRCLISAAPGVSARDLDRQADALHAEDWEVVTAPLPVLLTRLDLALVCSGTATLETALAGVPHEIVYRTSALNHAIARRLVRAPAIGLANLVLDAPLVAEHLQDDVAPEPLAAALADWCAQPRRRDALREGAWELRRRLGRPGVWERAAAAALALAGGSGARP